MRRVRDSTLLYQRPKPRDILEMLVPFGWPVRLAEVLLLAIQKDLRVDDRAEDLPHTPVPRRERTRGQVPVVPVGLSILPLVDEHDLAVLALLSELDSQLRTRRAGELSVLVPLPQASA